jgi:cation diffusion facilitator CzcD-associated flavoprotein CzcO
LQVIDYLEDYARQFELPIRFNQNVVSAERRDGLWEVTTQDAIYQSRFLVVATGLNEQPHVPTWPGQESFDGQILHSEDYKNGEPFRSQDVLVIGFGNSGGEIAIDLWEHGAKPGLAVRGPVNVIFRDLLGIPVQQLSIALSVLPPRISDALTAPVRYLVYGDIARYGLRKLPYGPVTQIRNDAQIPVIDVGVIRLIRAGRVRVYPGVREFTHEGVTFTDGATKPFGAVILATGYRAQAGAMFKEASRLTNGEGCPLVSGQETALPGLFFCGFRNAATGLLREIGIEAERIGKVIVRQQRPS